MNIIEKFGFFNSSNGDRVYDAADFAAYFGSLISNGIDYRTVNNLRVTAATGMRVTVAPGVAWLGGYRYENTAPLSLTIPMANGANPRIDRVVLRLSSAGRSIRAAILQGAASASPTVPALTRNADIWELGLCEITVPRATVSITAANIRDTRLNTNLCGLVNSLVSAVYE